MATETRTEHTFCRICESLCGLEVTVEDGTISRIRPDKDHVATGGFACIKGRPDHVDPASGMSTLTGIPVDVHPARGPRDTTSWSGISETPVEVS